MEQHLKNEEIQQEFETIKQEFIVNAPSEKEFTLSKANHDTRLQEDNKAGEAQKSPIGWNLKTLLLWILLGI